MLASMIALGLLGLGMPSDGPDDLRGHQDVPVPIVGGTEVPLGRWDAVGAFQIGVRFCSGTMVAPRLMLTAAHCLTGLSPSQAESILVVFGPSAYTPAAVTRAADFGVFERYCEECTRDRFDLGYVLLREAVSLPGGFPPLVTDQETWDAVMVDGKPMVAVGYGQSRDGEPSLADDKGVGIKREVGVSYRGFSESGLDFRAGGDGRGTCAGDSGGPAFVELEDGRWALAGVLSGGFGACGDGGLFMVPLLALPWIRDQTGVDLLPRGCADADCVDTTLPEDGCGCRSKPGTLPGPALACLLAVVVLRVRRRGAHSTQLQ